LLLYSNQLDGEIPNSICDLTLDFTDNEFQIQNNNFCPPYPECLTEEDIGYQDTSECVECTPGDFTGDSVLSILDVVSIVDFILESSFMGYEDCSDINGDGYLNILDVIILTEVILTQP